MRSIFSWLVIVVVFSLLKVNFLYADFDSYAQNPYVITHSGSSGDPLNVWQGGNIVVADITNDGDPDFLIRTVSKIYAYNHDDGSLLWQSSITLLGDSWNHHGGTYCTVDDITGDDIDDILAVNHGALNEIWCLNGATGISFRTITISLNTEQRVGHVVAVNLRGSGDRDIIVQTLDQRGEGNYQDFINRSVIAYNLEGDSALWSVDQNANLSSPFYEGYWGQNHGTVLCADVDGDGLDEIIGGTLIDPVSSTDPGTPTQLLSENWVHRLGSTYIDHIDQISIGDYNHTLDGLEWAIALEDDYHVTVGGDLEMYTMIFSKTEGEIWRREATDIISYFSPGYEQSIEPQNIAVGNFDLTRDYCETWNRCRHADSLYLGSQHPWLYDFQTPTPDLFTHYTTADSLPANFNGHANGNSEGVEMMWTMDWDGSNKDYLAAKARHYDGHSGIFDALDLSSQWNSIGSSVQTEVLFVADVQGDSREEVVLYDKTDNTLKIYQNTNANPSPGPNKWLDPLYKRVKETWNIYSPGSYTRPENIPVLDIIVFIEGAYVGIEQMNTLLRSNSLIPQVSPYSEDHRTVPSIPSNTVDWVLVQLRSTASGNAVFSKSAFLLNDGNITDEDGQSGIRLYGVVDGDYYVVIKHRNHLISMSAAAQTIGRGETLSYDFSSDSTQFYGNGGCKELESGVWGMWSGDLDQDGEITKTDYTVWFNSATTGESGYVTADCNGDGEVTTLEYTLWFNNIIHEASSDVP